MANPAVEAVKGKLRTIYRGLVDSLADTGASKLELKRTVHANIGIDPDPHRLQLLADVARFENAEARDACLRLLSVQFLAEDALDRFHGAEPLDPAAMRGQLASLPVIQATMRKMVADFEKALESMDRRHRDIAAGICAKLSWPAEELFAATTIGEQLERIGEATHRGTLPEEAPSLSERECELLKKLASPERREPTGLGLRARVDGIAMRALIERQLDAWRALPPPDGDEPGEDRLEAFKRLESTQMTYRVVSRRLGEARAGGLSGDETDTRDLRRTQQGLFAAYRELTKVVNAGPTHTGDVDSSDQAEVSAQLREQMLEAERAGAEIDSEKEARDDLLDEATTGETAAPPSEPDPAPARDIKRQRRRRKILVGIAATLLPVSISVNVLLYMGGPKKAVVSEDAFEPAMPVQKVVPVLDRVMNTHVSTFLWDNMTSDERIAKVEAMGRIAQDQGFADLHVLDEEQRERARWTLDAGVELIDDPAAP